ncbi:sensor histidine kinase [Arthrobacter sp. UM1]|uniref:sensor histidine kinase n=1 Tax=Arthrobacter sp. UM1 TaxID=2766776 RepID=UPI001CF65173|nr:sensor histidine kinase [Arthrobacter sp. UM1]MCB4208213.1 sensor histidine kinase [Arthrobacter sp. UM1]
MTTSQRRPSRRRPGGWVSALFAAVWLVFLWIPLATALVSSDPLGLRVLAVAAVVLFGAVYVVYWVALGSGAASRRRWTLPGVLGVMALLTAAAWPVIGLAVLSMAPYFVAVLVFSRPLRQAPAVVVGLTAVGAALILLNPEAWREAGSWWVAGGPLIGMLAVMVGRTAEEFGSREERARKALELSRQREEIGRDVHDILGHSLTVLAVKAQLAERLVELDPERARAEIADIGRISREALAEVRTTVTGLKSPDLDAALRSCREALESQGLRVKVTERGEPSEARSRLFAWVLREASTNILRHARASRVEIAVTEDSLRVADNGVGLPSPVSALGDSAPGGSASADPGNGLAGIRERVAAAGGEVAFSPAPPSRTPEHDDDGGRPGLAVTVTMSRAARQPAEGGPR